MLPHRAGHRDSHGQEGLQVRQAQEALQTQLAELQGRLTVQQQAWQKRQKILEDELAAQRSLAQQAQAQSNKAQEQLSQWLAQHQITVDAAQLQAENLHMPGVFLGNPSAQTLRQFMQDLAGQTD